MKRLLGSRRNPGITRDQVLCSNMGTMAPKCAPGQVQWGHHYHWQSMMPTNVQSRRCEQRPQTPAHSCCHHPYHRAKSLSGRRPQSPCLPPRPFFSLSAFSSKFRTAVFGWCCLGYMPEPQLHRSLGNQASDIFHFCNGRAHAPPRLMRWEIPKYRGVPDATEQKKWPIPFLTAATFRSHGRTGL